jgi:hypothetical protein
MTKMGQGADNIHRRRLQAQVHESQWCHGDRSEHSWMGHWKNPSR